MNRVKRELFAIHQTPYIDDIAKYERHKKRYIAHHDKRIAAARAVVDSERALQVVNARIVRRPADTGRKKKR